MKRSTSRSWPLLVSWRGLKGVVSSIRSECTSLHSAPFPTKQPTMATLSIRRDYRRPLPAWLFNISFRKSCLIGWRRDTPLPPLLYYGQRAPKRYASLQTSLTSSIFRASELPYSTWRTFSALHSPRYAPPPSHGRSLKRPSALLAGSSLDERVAHRHFHFVSNSGKLKEKQRDTRTPKEKPGKQHTNKKRKKQPGQLTF